MQKTPTKTHRAVVFIALIAALALCAYSGIVHKRVRPPRARSSIEELDARAKIHFDQAERNVLYVVADLTSTGNFIKLCRLMAGDKVSGTHKTQAYLNSMIRSRIIEHCRRGAKVYGCEVDDSAIGKELLESGRSNAKAAAVSYTHLTLPTIYSV